MARPGGKAKDRLITEGFNMEKKGVAKKDLRAARLEKARLEQQEKKQRTHVDKLEAELAGLKKALGDDQEAELERLAAEMELGDDEKNAFQMLRDMRQIYRSVGKRKLIQLMKDDKQFLFLVKELMKVEVSLLTAKIKAKEEGKGNGQSTVFVIMKGLHDDPRDTVAAVTVGNTVIDMQQIRSAIDPDAPPRTEAPADYQPDTQGLDAPETW